MRAVILLMAVALAASCVHGGAGDGTHTYAALKSATVRFNPGMSAKEVVALIGTPDEQEGNICGSAVGAGWKCTTWIYKPSDTRAAALYVTLQGEPTSLTVNEWSWR